MHEFDTYISTIIDGLKISERKKEELFDEFKDHLVSLKSEFINDGFSEADAINKAIVRFGKSSDIKAKLNKSLYHLRNLKNILFGAVIALIALIFCCIPMTGLVIANSSYYKATDISHMFFSNILNIINCVLLFVPLGYFVPIILNRPYKAYKYAFVYSVTGVLIGVCYNLIMTQHVNAGFILAYLASGLAGGMLGYVTLLFINKLNMTKKDAMDMRTM